ncbi:tRNA-dependent cyclodipeptide synthase [Streptomyces lydicus]|uniref:Cyclodipeptide synthase n=1 Tax=Streptomyces lydicus TaxID=47763 RepID=A0A3Q9K6X5_9ACTN|nr:tRNA-dependent cyclodipeptide synthase [Streptomyces lydicus]AZS69941.1 tRNA-dependent cyclodipeptide synthase [Streptomyces lydicus]
MLQASPATSNCQAIFGRRAHVLLGVSPFNSRFCDAYIARLVAWAHASVQDFDVLLPGVEHASWILEAVGESRPQAKARKEVARRKRAVEEALEACAPELRVAVHDFGDFADNPHYLGLRDEVDRVFATDEGFRRACLAMSRQAVSSRLRTVRGPDACVDDHQAAAAVRYVLDELPHVLDGATILGREETLMVYHRPWPLWDRIAQGEFPLKVSPRQGFLVLHDC